LERACHHPGAASVARPRSLRRSRHAKESPPNEKTFSWLSGKLDPVHQGLSRRKQGHAVFHRYGAPRARRKLKVFAYRRRRPLRRRAREGFRGRAASSRGAPHHSEPRLYDECPPSRSSCAKTAPLGKGPPFVPHAGTDVPGSFKPLGDACPAARARLGFTGERRVGRSGTRVPRSPAE